MQSTDLIKSTISFNKYNSIVILSFLGLAKDLEKPYTKYRNNYKSAKNLLNHRNKSAKKSARKKYKSVIFSRNRASAIN